LSTIKDVARLAGVGVGTVSRVLNGGKNVRKDTMDRVLECARILNYRVSKSARDLARKGFSTETIGITLPIAVHPFYLEVLKGAYAYLNEQGYNLLIFNIGHKTDEVFHRIVDEILAGVIAVSRPIPDEYKRLFEIAGTSYICLDYFSENGKCLYIDNRYGGKLAARFLIERGARNIAYIGESVYSQQQDERIAGFQEELFANGISIKCEKYISMDEQEAFNITMDIIGKFDIDGVFYFCDELAYGGLRARTESGKRFDIIGYDDRDASQYLGLSTIRQPAFEIGFDGAKKIDGFIKNGNQGLSPTPYLPKLIIRD
jgi:LacI family transcriptional regulator